MEKKKKAFRELLAWHGLIHQTCDLVGDTLSWHKSDSSHRPPPPSSFHSRIESMLNKTANLIVRSLVFMEMHTKFLPILCLSTVYSFVDVLCVHTCKYSEYTQEEKQGIQGLS